MPFHLRGQNRHQKTGLSKIGTHRSAGSSSLLPIKMAILGGIPHFHIDSNWIQFVAYK